MIVILGLFQLVDPPTQLRGVSKVMSVLAMSVFLYMLVKNLRNPPVVLELREDHICFVGLFPSVWTLFQLWKSVTIPNANVTSIEIGRVSDGLRLGKSHLADLNGDRGVSRRRVCVIQYIEQGREVRIYHPNVDGIENLAEMQRALECRFGGRLVLF